MTATLALNALMTVYVLSKEDCGIKPRNCGTRKKNYFTVTGTVRMRLQEKGANSIIRYIDD